MPAVRRRQFVATTMRRRTARRGSSRSLSALIRRAMGKLTKARFGRHLSPHVAASVNAAPASRARDGLDQTSEANPPRSAVRPSRPRWEVLDE
jgi:hypothetical protein